MAPHRGTDQLTPEQRAIARALRQAARIVGHAALPAEYRAAAFCYIAPSLVNSSTTDEPAAPEPAAGRRPARTW